MSLPGEVNPLPRTPLEVVSVRPTSACTGVGFDVASSSSVRASWTADAPGATCAASVTLKDAQGRSTAGTRDARVVLDLQGFPRAPASVRQTAYADGSLTLRIDPGEARRAYPALTGFRVRFGGQVVAECGPDGSCPSISAPNGEQREYVVTAVNAVGESSGSVRTNGWAYDPPAKPGSGEFTPVVTRGGEGNVADLVIRGVESAETGQLEIRSAAGETRTVSVGRNQNDVRVDGFQVGSNSSTQITVIPTSRFQVPAGLGGSAQGGVLTFSAHGVGAPLDPNMTITSRSTGDGVSTVTVEGTARQNGTDSQLRYGIAEGGFCRVGDDGPRREFPGKLDGVAYTFTFCVESSYDGTSYGSQSVTQEYRVAQDTAAPRGYTFEVGARPDYAENGSVARWRISGINEGSKPPRFNDVRYSASTTAGRRSSAPTRTSGSTSSTRSGARRPRPPGRARVGERAVSGAGEYPGGILCRRRTPPGVVGLEQRPGGGEPRSRGRPLHRQERQGPHPARGIGPGPQGATTVTNVLVTVDWSARGWGLDKAVLETSGTCQPGTPSDDPSAPTTP